jgi:hypothetical protein
MSWTYKAKQLFGYLFWGTHDDKYVIDHLGRKIIFFDKSLKYKDKPSTSWGQKSKVSSTWSYKSK